MDFKAIETKLSNARSRLILDKPFLGALVLRLPMVAAHHEAWCEKMATDARQLYYNPEYIDALTPAQVQFALAHEALHCALSHFARRGHRHKQRWDVACDYAINPILLDEGLEPVPGALFDKSFHGMTAEEIYPSISHTQDDEPQDNHLFDDTPSNSSSPSSLKPKSQCEEEAGQGGGKQPPPLSEREKQELDTQWQQRLAGAAQQAKQAGKFGAGMQRFVDQVLQPKLPWRNLLARFVSQTARNDYSYQRPSSRRQGDAIFPNLRSEQVNLAIAIDTSGSVVDEEIAEFMAEIHALHAQVNGRLLLLPCDAELADGAPFVFEPWETPQMPQSLAGGGGTQFAPVFACLDALDLAPDVLIYFTDGHAPFPEQPPAYPVVWLIKGEKVVPWGQRIQLN